MEEEQDRWVELSEEATEIMLAARGREGTLDDYLSRSKDLMWNLQGAYAEYLTESASDDELVKRERRFDEAVKQLHDHKITTFDDDFNTDDGIYFLSHSNEEANAKYRDEIAQRLKHFDGSFTGSRKGEIYNGLLDLQRRMNERIEAFIWNYADERINEGFEVLIAFNEARLATVNNDGERVERDERLEILVVDLKRRMLELRDDAKMEFYESDYDGAYGRLFAYVRSYRRWR